MQPLPTPELLYEIVQPSLLADPWLRLSAALLPIALAAYIWQRRRGQPLVLPGFFVVASLVMLGAISASLWDQQRLTTALQQGQVLVAEGRVQSHEVRQRASYNGNTKRYDRSTWEAFLVGEVAFGFSRGSSASGFTNAGDAPVALADGDQLRVLYVEDTPGDYASRRILRLERLRPGAAHGFMATRPS